MITVYTYKGRFGDDLPADYIPCLIGNDQGGEEAYFETLCEITAADISAHKASKWFSGPTRIISIRFWAKNGQTLGYALADDLMTAGVDF